MTNTLRFIRNGRKQFMTMWSWWALRMMTFSQHVGDFWLGYVAWSRKRHRLLSIYFQGALTFFISVRRVARVLIWVPLEGNGLTVFAHLWLEVEQQVLSFVWVCVVFFCFKRLCAAVRVKVPACFPQLVLLAFVSTLLRRLVLTSVLCICKCHRSSNRVRFDPLLSDYWWPSRVP